MVPFAGYEMPVQYEHGIIAEHRHTRSAAGLFDVSHMGQFLLSGERIASTLESLMPADLAGLGEHRQTYALLTNEDGGVRDDLIVTRWGPEQFLLVVNAACKDDDRAWIEANLQPTQRLEVLEAQALLALQGPGARAVLKNLLPDVATLPFLHGGHFELDGIKLYVSCSGYTGEDGFELSCPAADATSLARRMLAAPEVLPIGLGARDSLRLEAGLCLYGHELAPTITPIEAGIAWAVSRARRPDGDRPGGYPGAEHIEAQLAAGPRRRRVGLTVNGKRPVREGQAVVDDAGRHVGEITSGGFGASVNAPIALALIDRAAAESDVPLSVNVRGRLQGVTRSRTPFIAPRYYRG
jgi:aminomethyltransferase